MVGLEERIGETRRTRRLRKPLQTYLQEYAGLTRRQVENRDLALYQRLVETRLILGVPKNYGSDLALYCEQYYPAQTPQQIRTRNESLYDLIMRAGLAQEIPRATANARPAFDPANDDPVIFYNTWCKGMSRGQLNKNLHPLYYRLRKTNQLGVVPLKTSGITRDPLGFYNANYAGMTREELRRKHVTLYQRLSLNGVLNHVPTEKSRSDLCNGRAWELYETKYTGYGRTRLRDANRALYNQLHETGEIERIARGHSIELPPKKQRRECGPTSIARDPLGNYHARYEGVPREELITKNYRLYSSLARNGLLNEIPSSTDKRLRFNAKRDNPLEYYHAHFGGQTQHYLEKNQKTLYRTLCESEDIDSIPLIKKRTKYAALVHTD